MSELTVLCYRCGVSFTVAHGTANPTQQCPDCKKSGY